MMGRTYACADAHGCKDVMFQILDYLQPDDKLYFLGDAIDRGDHGIEILDRLLMDKRVIILMGNHERMMVDILNRAFKIGVPDDEMTDFLYDNDLWFYNGGYPTWKNGLNLGKTREDWHNYCWLIEHMPYKMSYKSNCGHIVILEHAGFTPTNTPHRSHDSLWDREHFYDKWEENQENIYIVHGHTPVQYLKYDYGYNGQPPLTKVEMEDKNHWRYDEPMNEKPTVIRYCSGHKFDIDMCTIASGRMALLDLDTFETIYFDKEN